MSDKPSTPDRADSASEAEQRMCAALGFRAADTLGHDFLRAFREAVREQIDDADSERERWAAVQRGEIEPRRDDPDTVAWDAPQPAAPDEFIRRDITAYIALLAEDEHIDVDHVIALVRQHDARVDRAKETWAERQTRGAWEAALNAPRVPAQPAPVAQGDAEWVSALAHTIADAGLPLTTAYPVARKIDIRCEERYRELVTQVRIAITVLRATNEWQGMAETLAAALAKHEEPAQ